MKLRGEGRPTLFVISADGEALARVIPTLPHGALGPTFHKERRMQTMINLLNLLAALSCIAVCIGGLVFLNPFYFIQGVTGLLLLVVLNSQRPDWNLALFGDDKKQK